MIWILSGKPAIGLHERDWPPCIIKNTTQKDVTFTVSSLVGWITSDLLSRKDMLLSAFTAA